MHNVNTLAILAGSGNKNAERELKRRLVETLAYPRTRATMNRQERLLAALTLVNMMKGRR